MKQEQLQKVLNSLVADFGYENVRKRLGELRPIKTTSAGHGKKSDSVSAAKSTPESGKKKSKLTAMKFVQSLPIADTDKKEILFTIAEKYEAKEFMPNVNHVRGFLIDGRRDVSRIKSRQQVTAAVFKQLADLETSKLREMVERGIYGPRKKLKPFARAIEGFSRPSRST